MPNELQISNVKLLPCIDLFRHSRHWDSKLFWTFDPGHLRQVFLNLLKNSIQVLPQNGKIMVVFGKEKKIFIDIKDDGPGVVGEKQKLIFEPFFSTQKGHTGLGLAIAKNLMEENYGSIQYIQSKSGAWFRLIFN